MIHQAPSGTALYAALANGDRAVLELRKACEGTLRAASARSTWFPVVQPDAQRANVRCAVDHDGLVTIVISAPRSHMTTEGSR